MPVIAIVHCSKLPDYEISVRRAGADVRVLERSADSPADVIASVDGLVLTGGGDVQPALYGATPHPTVDLAEPGRDEFELELVRRALDADLPMLAICRGVQVLNVARGGTLVQHIPDEVGLAISHRAPELRDSTVHEIRVVGGSLLERVLREGGHEAEARGVNSRHHQAARDVGQGLVISATAPDGVIEALESPHHRFVLGVQWHPENFCRTGRFQALFDALVRQRGI
jgi:putative glutamine amidotransferase